jgi:hypothetical protein
VTTPQPESGSAVASAQQKRERLRFTRFSFTRTPTAHCTAEVELEWVNEQKIIGRASGVASPVGDLRLASDATLRAVETFSNGALQFELIGVKTMRAFDSTVVIVSVLYTRADSPQRLLGVHLADEDPLRSAVVATLQATNRLLGNYIATR